MKTLLKFFKTTILGGVFFLLPIVLVLLALNKILHFVAKILSPVVKSLSLGSVAGMDASYLLAILLLFSLSFLAGLIAHTALGTRMKSWLENTILQLVPGYTVLKGLGGEAGNPETSRMSTALLGTEGKWELCFVVERHPNGYLTVFKPGAPHPTSGSVFFVSPGQVQELNIPVTEAMKCLMRDGDGAVDLLRDKLR